MILFGAGFIAGVVVTAIIFAFISNGFVGVRNLILYPIVIPLKLALEIVCRIFR